MVSKIDYSGFKFEVTKRSATTRARRGLLTTPHGTIETPNFIFCATKAAMKCVLPEQLAELGVDIILSNTYHLNIQPGAEIVEQHGGLHNFMQWKGPMLTDSGGFQIFSLGAGSSSNEIKGKRTEGRAQTLLKITEEGANFRSYTDGRKLTLTPESATKIQRQLGADMIVQFDECTPYHVDKNYTAKSMRLSQRWGDRSLAEFVRLSDSGEAKFPQAMYGVIQGGVHHDLRDESAAYVRDRPFFGTAIGGCLGDQKEMMMEVADWSMQGAHLDRPVHLLGIGGLTDIVQGVDLGIDTFDCVSPTRIARHGWALLPGAPSDRINLRNAKFREDQSPLNPLIPCRYSQNYSRAYIHHLLRAGEILALQILSLHNIATMVQHLKTIRATI